MFGWFKRRRREKDMARLLAAELMSLCELLGMSKIEIVEMLFFNHAMMNDFDWNTPEEGRRQRFFDFLVTEGFISARQVEHVKADPVRAAKLQSWFEQPSLIQL